MPREYVNLQRFCSDFIVPAVCVFTEILWCLDLQRFCLDILVPRVCQFTEILLNRFYGASRSIYRDFTMP